MMELERARYLASPEGQRTLAAAAKLVEGFGVDPTDPLRTSWLLRRSLAPDHAAAVSEQLMLRARAQRNHGREGEWLYTSEGLEMMTHPLVAERRAARLAGLGLPVLDLCCGLGGDLAAVMAAGASAAGVERDPAHALFAGRNTGARVVRGDVTEMHLDLGATAVLIDPSRRDGSGRRLWPGAFSPPWDVVLELAGAARAAAIKAPPGISDNFVPPGAEFEAVQLGRSMREVCLWLGEGAAAGTRRAVLLPEGVTLDSSEPEAAEEPAAPGAYLFDPESCVTVATLVRHLAWRLGARLLDPRIAYLTAPEPAFSPLAATFEVLDTFPFSVGRLKERLRGAGWRPSEVRRRAFPVEPDELKKLLGRMEGDPVTLLLTTIDGRRTVFVARRLFAPA
jgi:hypothetical protein